MTKLKENGVAECSGQLFPGDQILSAITSGGIINLRSATHLEAATVLRDCGMQMQLEVCYNPEGGCARGHCRCSPCARVGYTSQEKTILRSHYQTRPDRSHPCATAVSDYPFFPLFFLLRLFGRV